MRMHRHKYVFRSNYRRTGHLCTRLSENPTQKVWYLNVFTSQASRIQIILELHSCPIFRSYSMTWIPNKLPGINLILDHYVWFSHTYTRRRCNAGALFCLRHLHYVLSPSVVFWYRKRISAVPLPVFHWQRYLLQLNCIKLFCETSLPAAFLHLKTCWGNGGLLSVRVFKIFWRCCANF